MFDLVIHNGTVVLTDVVVEMDVGVLDGKVAALGHPGQLMEAREQIDASGLYVFPGFIDAHVHVNLPTSDQGGTAWATPSSSICAILAAIASRSIPEITSGIWTSRPSGGVGRTTTGADASHGARRLRKGSWRPRQ